MARRGRRKKITYDSGETRIVFGLIALFVAVIAVLSNYASGQAFELVKNTFGDSTLVLALAAFVLSLRLFNVKPDRITNRSVIGSILILIAVATFQTGGLNMPPDLRNLSYEGEYGGIVGFEVSNWLGTVLFQDIIRPLMAIIVFLAVPLLFSIKLQDYFGFQKKIIMAIAGFFGGIGNGLSKLTQPRERKVLAEDKIEPADYNEAKMVGDFRLREQIESKTQQTPKQKPKPSAAEVSKKNKEALKNVKFTEADEGEDLIMQNELKYPDWQLPPMDLLNKGSKKKPSQAGIKQNSQIIERTLQSFNIETQVVDVLIGPTVTQYALDIALGTKVSKISNLRTDLALALATPANAVRIEAPIPGTSYVGIEVPNKERQMVGFREVLENYKDEEGNLQVTIGKNIAGDNVLGDIQRMPHLLIAGATGSGKSVVTNSFIMSLLMKKSPDQVRFIMVDPKQVELSDYNGIPHLLTPVITEMEKVNNALKWAIAEMERRYTEFKDNSVRNIEGYNEKMGYTAIPYIVVVIDEMADMMMTNQGSEIEASIVRLAQKARATGIHLILATQRPSVDVITGLIKANIPGRIGMSVTTQVDSRVILDQIGSEALLGKGDLLYKDPGQSRVERIQNGFISQPEVLRVVEFIKDQAPEVEYTMDITKTPTDPNAPEGADIAADFSDDDLFIAAAKVVVQAQKGSSSLIQRKLSVGYNRAARLLDELHEHGLVGPANGSKPRDVYYGSIDSFLAEANGEV